MASTRGFEPPAYRLRVLKAMSTLVSSRYVEMQEDALFAREEEGLFISSVSSRCIQKHRICWQNVCKGLPTP